MTDRPTDQASGLRNMLGTPRSRKFAFVSAITGPQKFAVMSNLAAALAHNGSEVMMLDASHAKDSLRRRLPANAAVSLFDALTTTAPAENWVHELSTGIRWCQLSHAPLNQIKPEPAALHTVSALIEQLGERSNVWLVDIDHESDPPFALPDLAQAQLVVLCSCQTASIKKAYALIKSLHALLGRRNIELLVYAATAEQANVVLRNLSQAAQEYLAMGVTGLGYLPIDDDLARAMQMKRSVIEAFPLSTSASAFKKIATQMLQVPAAARTRTAAKKPGASAASSAKGLRNV